MLKRLFGLCLLLTFFIFPTIAQDAVPVPDVRRLPLPQAASILNLVGLNLGEDTTADSVEGQAPNTIVTQSLEPGATAPRGTAINVTVLRAPNVRLVYDDNDITFVNLTQEPMNVNGIAFSTSDGTPTSYNANQITGGLGGAECLQLWSITLDAEGCADVLSQLRVAANGTLWIALTAPGEEAWQESVFRTELTKEGFVNFHAMDSRFCFCPFAMKREKTPI